jgi:putative ABC transport system permease protein
VDLYSASPAFFQTLGVPLLRGREFDLRDRAAVIVSQSLARAFWPWQDPIGKALPLPGGSATVVGVARDVDPLRFGGSDNPAAYRPWRLSQFRNVLSVRFDRGETGGAAAVRAAIHEVDPDLMVVARLAQTWLDLITEDLWNVVALIVILGGVATVLATTGIYGAVSFAVSQRTKEMGIRVALGAQRLDIVSEVFRSGGRPVLQGLVVGLWLSVATAAGLRQSTRGSPLRLDTANPLLFLGAAILLAVAATFAMVAPARRGARSDPLDALRCE